MIDRRENILAKILEILKTIEGMESIERNRDQLPADMRPAILLLDGHEEARRDADGRGRVGAAPNRVIMKPEIYIALDTRKPKNLNVGPRLNAFRALVIGKLMTNSELEGMCENMFYAGSISDLAKDGGMDGVMGISIEFTYLLKPAEL